MIKTKRAPYSDTTITAENTRAEIDRLLRSYGVQDFQWTELWSKGVVRLEFAIEKEPGHYVRVRVSPPPFTAKRRTWNEQLGRHVIVEAPNWAQSMRCLLHWLKAKLESVAFGLKSVEDEFLSDIVVRAPDGSERTVAELVRPALSSGVLDVPALTGERHERQVHDAEGRVVS